MEIKKEIKGYEGLYVITSSGKVISLGNGKSTNPGTKRIRQLKTQIKSNGYQQVKLSKNGRSKYFTVHRLVATHFLVDQPGKKEVNHKDGNKLNNHVNNLEWVNSSENQKHAFKTGLQKPVKGAENKQSKKVVQMDLTGRVLKTWDSLGQLKRNTGFNTYGIIKCCKGQKKYKTAYGYKWKYHENG